jgi:uncharacterized protein YlzI (FlbEa/FlbD family)
MQFIKVTKCNGAITLYINPQHIMHIDPLNNGGAVLCYISGQHTKVDQSAEEILTLINQ